MATLEELKATLVRIETAYNSGVLSVQHGETRTQYRSLEEMERIIAKLKAEIGGLENKPGRSPGYVRQGGRG